ncbi:hypothetical protein ECDEC7D_3521 [Escherichia coli DEC7D]|nr:hypothetical protein ECDEC7D_3521 [Escherichia coli DEC7D]
MIPLFNIDSKKIKLFIYRLCLQLPPLLKMNYKSREND